jgi:hypothetical protein
MGGQPDGKSTALEQTNASAQTTVLPMISPVAALDKETSFFP